jgi:PhzF family phenazine biosynthesis protein
MSLLISIVDAFASGPFTGNPAAVCLVPGPADPAWMQSLAAEMNLSETAFVSPREDGWDLRWFTPKVEVALCGHATLASAHTLWESGRAAAGGCIRFHTASGWLSVNQDGPEITMDFPAKPVTPAPAPPGLEAALGATPGYVGRSEFDYLVELNSAGALHALAPDFAALGRLPVRGVIVTSRSDQPGFDFLSRFFAPAAGVNEDPVTGSAHCALGPYWQERLGRTDFVAYQASARGGIVRVGVRGDRVRLGGRAVTVLRGVLA